MSDDVLVLNDDDVERLADMRALIEVMKCALAEQARGGFVSPPRHDVKFAPGHLVFTVGGTPQVGGFRVYNTFARDFHSGQLAGSGAQTDDRQIVAAWDLETNQLQGVVIGNHLSAYRAGSLGGVGVDLLAPREAKVCGVIGTGHHATTQLLAAATVRKFDTIRVYSRSADNRARFADQMSTRLGRTVLAAKSAEETVRGADVVLTATNANTPVMQTEWLGPNAYLGSVGPKYLKAHELPPALGMRAAVIATDTPSQFAALKNNHFLTGTADFDRVRPLNEFLNGTERTSGIALFLLTGLAGSEVLTASWLLRAATKRRP